MLAGGAPLKFALVAVISRPIPALSAGIGRPITATSANLSGETPASTLEEARSGLGEKVKVYLEGGKLTASAPSTVVAVNQNGWKMVRLGAISERQIAMAPELATAVDAAYEAAQMIEFEGRHFRRDIARRALG